MLLFNSKAVLSQ